MAKDQETKFRYELDVYVNCAVRVRVPESQRAALDTSIRSGEIALSYEIALPGGGSICGVVRRGDFQSGALTLVPLSAGLYKLSGRGTTKSCAVDPAFTEELTAALKGKGLRLWASFKSVSDALGERFDILPAEPAQPAVFVRVI
jgi:hypothetical protein